MSKTGPNPLAPTLTFQTTTNPLNFARVVLQTSTEKLVNLPSGDNPAVIPVGINTVAANFSGGDTTTAAIPVLIHGIAMVEVASGGTATAGQAAIVKNTGTVTNITTNATPVVQTVIGLFLSAGTAGDYVAVLLFRMFITQ